MNTPNTPLPRARNKDLAIQDMNAETLIYDKRSHKAHCLTPLAGMVWRHCDGSRNKADLAKIVSTNLGLPEDTDVVDLALQELMQADLLDATVPASQEQFQHTRRELLRKFRNHAVAAAVLVPLVSSIMTQSAMAQASPATTTTTRPPT